MVKILVHLFLGCMVYAGLFHALVDSVCACLDPNPVKCKPIPSFSIFLSSGGCVGDTRPRLIKFAINK